MSIKATAIRITTINAKARNCALIYNVHKARKYSAVIISTAGNLMEIFVLQQLHLAHLRT